NQAPGGGWGASGYPSSSPRRPGTPLLVARANKKAGRSPPLNARWHGSVEPGAHVPNGVLDQGIALFARLLGQQQPRCLDRDLGGAGANLGKRLGLGLGNLVFHRLGAAGDEVLKRGFGLGGHALGLLAGIGDDLLGLSFSRLAL